GRRSAAPANRRRAGGRRPIVRAGEPGTAVAQRGRGTLGQERGAPSLQQIPDGLFRRHTRMTRGAHSDGRGATPAVGGPDITVDVWRDERIDRRTVRHEQASCDASVRTTAGGPARYAT